MLAVQALVQIEAKMNDRQKYGQTGEQKDGQIDGQKSPGFG